MADENHPNYVKTYPATQELLDQIYSRTAQDLLDKRECERRALEWPGDVERLLSTLVGAIQTLEMRLAQLEAAKG